MKNIAKIFYIILFSILPFLVFSEIFLYIKKGYEFKERFEISNKQLGLNAFKVKYYSKPRSFEVFSTMYKVPQGIINKNYSGKSVIIFGCSYTQSAEIKDKFCYKLSDELQSPLFNFSVSGGGTQHMYYFLTHDKYWQNVENPEYIIYVFINDHIRRFYMPLFWHPFVTIENLRYKNKDGKIERIKPVFFQFWTLFTVKQIQEYIYYKYIETVSQEDLFLNFVEFMKEVKKESRKKFPNAKSVIVLYNDKIYNFDKDFINNSDWNLLRKEGFYVFDTKNLTDKDLSAKEYKCEDKFHPNAKAWEEVIPNLVKELRKI